MSNDNFNNCNRQAQAWEGIHVNYHVELEHGKNYKQCTKATVYFNNKLVTSFSCSAFTKNDMTDMLEGILLNTNTSYATAKVEHAHARGNYDAQGMTYAKELSSLLDEGYNYEKRLFSYNKDFKGFNVDNFVNKVYDAYGMDAWQVHVNLCKAKAWYGQDKQDVLNRCYYRVKQDLYITKHMQNKINKVLNAYNNFINNKVFVTNEILLSDDCNMACV